MKTCSKCGEEKRIDDFHIWRSTGNVSSICTECKNVQAKGYREKCKTLNKPVTVSNKKCSKCGFVKEASDFYKDRRLNSGLSSSCSVCHANKRTKQRESGYIKFYHILRRYNLTREQYYEIKEKQGNKCAICESKIKTYFNKKGTELVVDHDHSSGEVRGLLCAPCNILLGKVEKYGGTDYLDKIKAYIQASNKE